MDDGEYQLLTGFDGWKLLQNLLHSEKITRQMQIQKTNLMSASGGNFRFLPENDIKIVQFRTSKIASIGAVLIGHWLLDTRYEYPTFVDKNSEEMLNVSRVRKIVFMKKGNMKKLYEKMLEEKSYFSFGL